MSHVSRAPSDRSNVHILSVNAIIINNNFSYLLHFRKFFFAMCSFCMVKSWWRSYISVSINLQLDWFADAYNCSAVFVVCSKTVLKTKLSSMKHQKQQAFSIWQAGTSSRLASGLSDTLMIRVTAVSFSVSWQNICLLCFHEHCCRLVWASVNSRLSTTDKLPRECFRRFQKG